MERLTYDFCIREKHCWQIKGADNFMCKEVCENQDGCEKCPIAEAFDRLAAYEDTGMTPEEITGLCSMNERAKMADLLRLEEYQEIGSIDHFRELAQAEKDGWPPVTPRAKTCDAHTAEAEYLLGVLWNGLHNNDGMDSKVADRVAEIAHEGDKVQPATTPKNDPLTLDELLEMDGEPVWLEREQSAYYDVLHISKSGDSCCFYTTQLYAADYGKTWLAYRRKPEEGP